MCCVSKVDLSRCKMKNILIQELSNLASSKSLMDRHSKTKKDEEYKKNINEREEISKQK